jgi:hypothetical protein
MGTWVLESVFVWVARSSPFLSIGINKLFGDAATTVPTTRILY